MASPFQTLELNSPADSLPALAPSKTTNSCAPRQVLHILVSREDLKTAKDELDSEGLFDRGPKIQRWTNEVQEQCPASLSVSLSLTPEQHNDLFLVPTKISVSAPTAIHTLTPEQVKEQVSLPSKIQNSIRGFVALACSPGKCDIGTTKESAKVNPLVRSLTSFLETLPPKLLYQAINQEKQPDNSIPPGSLIGAFSFPTHYTLFPPQLLLLPRAVFSSPEWTALFSLISPDQKSTLFDRVASEFKVSHIAIPGFIPVDTDTDTDTPSDKDQAPSRPQALENDLSLEGHEEKQRISKLLRLPTEIVPLHGFFGPLENHTVVVPVQQPYFDSSLPLMTHPRSQQAVDKTLFVTVRQFGLDLVFPPLRCMFSRGNVRERERLMRVLGDPFSQTDVTTESPTPTPRLSQSISSAPIPCTAVDLFAGIGYFSFCYAASSPRSGVQLVATWEINGWSVEAMYRGTVANKWSAEIICLGEPSSPSLYSCARKHTPSSSNLTAAQKSKKALSQATAQLPPADPRFLIHHAPHQTARSIIRSNRSDWPPVRHVNLGYLPLSSVDGAWTTAFLAIDEHYGGWIRVHENVNMKSRFELPPASDSNLGSDKSGDGAVLAARAQEIVGEFKNIWNEVRTVGPEEGERRESIKVVDIIKVKSYSPGVVHCVFDVWIPGAAKHL